MKKSTLRRALFAATAAAAVGAGSLAPAPAHAAAPELRPIAACTAGEQGTYVDVLGNTVDCSASSPSIIGEVGDAIAGLFLPGVSLSDLNGATALGIELLRMPGAASVSGDGFTTAIGVGGDATANAGGVLSGAISIGVADGSGTADSTFGGISLALGGMTGVAQAQALPLGVATAFGFAMNASATALGGFASANGSAGLGDDPVPTTVCTALYGAASVTSLTGGNLSSCTSILFIFQRSQQGDGPVVYSIKNPFAVALTAPFGQLDKVTELAGLLGLELPVPSSITDLLGGKFVPQLSEDLIRVSVDNDGGIQFGSDVFGQKADPETSGAADTAVVAKQSTVAPAVEPNATESVVDETESPAAVTSTGDDAADQAQAPETETAPAPAADAPAEDADQVASVDGAPTADAPAADAPAADTDPSDASSTEDAPAAA